MLTKIFSKNLCKQKERYSFLLQLFCNKIVMGIFQNHFNAYISQMQSNNQNGFRFFLKEVSLFSFTCILKHSCLQKNKQIQFCEKAGSYMKIRMLLQKKFQFHYGKCLAYMPSSLTQWSQLISEGELNTCTCVFKRNFFDSYTKDGIG